MLSPSRFKRYRTLSSHRLVRPRPSHSLIRPLPILLIRSSQEWPINPLSEVKDALLVRLLVFLDDAHDALLSSDDGIMVPAVLSGSRDERLRRVASCS